MISDSAVDWSGTVEPQPGVDPPAANDPEAAEPPSSDEAAADQTARLPGLPPELENGPALRDNLQLGFSYRLNLAGEWQSVRLTYMSPGRTLFLFSHGAKDRETISMTARTLGRLCAAGRMRALETAFLIDRATTRARQQLTALKKAA